MKLGVKERISIVKMINASKSGFADRITLQAIKTEIDFTEAEVKKLSMRDVNLGNQVTTTWDPKKAEKCEKEFYLSKERSKVLKKIIIQICQQSQNIIDGLTGNLFDNLKWTKEDLNALSGVVDAMDKNEQITEFNFSICKKIKDKAGSKSEKEDQ